MCTLEVLLCAFLLRTYSVEFWIKLEFMLDLFVASIPDIAEQVELFSNCYSRNIPF